MLTPLRTVDSVACGLRRTGQRLPKPQYTGRADEDRSRVALAVESMKYHTTDEGWQIMAGLESAGYRLAGHNLAINDTNIRTVVRDTDPGVVVVQDKREWDVQRGDFREPAAQFRNQYVLKERKDVFKLTILKDSHQRPDYHRQSAEEIDCHAWIVYYHPTIVTALAPYVRPEHVIRTYHSVDSWIVPKYSASNRRGCLMSGAVSGVYPLRKRIIERPAHIPEMDYLKHPGYHRNGCATPKFLHQLSDYKVAICTSSVYGYALRKIIEATACGCIVVTDLPTDEVLPAIDANLVRVSPDISLGELGNLIRRLYAEYDAERQRLYAEHALQWYDYRTVCSRLAADIENVRRGYCGTN